MRNFAGKHRFDLANGKWDHVTMDHLPMLTRVGDWRKTRTNTGFLGGAGDGTRTRDNLLGRQELYQLSYPRRLSEYTSIPAVPPQSK